MLHTLTVIFLKEQSCFTLLNFCLSHLQQNSVQARQITALLSVSSSLRPSVTIGNNFHWCLVRSRPFTGTGRFLAGLFTFLRRQPIVNQLRVGGRNWFRTVITTMKKTGLSFLHSLSWCVAMLGFKIWLVLHTCEQWEASSAAGNWCRQRTTTDFVQLSPTQACQLLTVFWQLTLHLDVRETETEQEKKCSKPLIEMHSVKCYTDPNFFSFTVL